MVRCALPVFSAMLVFACGGGDWHDVIPPFNLYTDIAINDLSGDTRLDIVASNIYIADKPPHPGFATILFHRETVYGDFQAVMDISAGSDPEAVATGDLNGDSCPDIITANYGDGTVSIILQAGAHPGGFYKAYDIQVGASANGVVIGDLNGDGLNDIVATGSRLALLYNTADSPGNFDVYNVIDISTAGAALGDLNEDGILDIAVADWTSVIVLLQDAPAAVPGTFSDITRYPAGFQPIDVAIADLDMDGNDDLAVANLGSPDDPESASASVLIQQADPALKGKFQQSVSYDTGARSQSVAIGDLNNDGRPDLAIANAGRVDPDNTGNVSVLMQSATPGVFLPASHYKGLSQPLAVAIADINHDGLNDLVVADDGVVIRFQKASAPGDFMPAVQFY